MKRDAVYFVSDAHFGLGTDDERAKIEHFAELAAHMRGHAADVYLVGDMFDFWIEYKSAIRRDYFPVLYTLRGLVEAGVRVHYITGNHDFALGTFLEEAVGILVHRGAANVTLQGRKACISHGDEVNKSGYFRLLKALLHNSRLRALYKLIHPDIGIRAGTFISALSKRKYSNLGLSPKDLKRYRNAAQARLRERACDLVVFAHTHHADFVNLDGGDYCNTGSWMVNRDYAVMRGGRVQLMRWGEKS